MLEFLRGVPAAELLDRGSPASAGGSGAVPERDSTPFRLGSVHPAGYTLVRVKEQKTVSIAHLTFAHGLAAALFLCLIVPWGAQGHEVLAAYIQHQVVITLSARYLDVTVHLTFFEDSSEHEREHMDSSKDGQLSRAETAAYLEQLQPKLAGALNVRVDGQPLTLAPLREPELDLLGHSRTGRWHHRLSLFFFAPTPARLPVGAELVLENRLWPGVRAVGLLQAEGRDGAKLEAVSLRDALLPPSSNSAPREFKVRLLAPPGAELSRPAGTQR